MNRIPLVLFALLAAALLPARGHAEAPKLGIYNPLHGYFSQAPRDRFTRLSAELAAGQKSLDPSGELPLLRSLLHALEVPEASQMLVYSVTSLQKSLISPRRPRALFFNDDTYVGFVPGGRMEIIATDAELGCIYFIYDRLAGRTVPPVVRSTECFNCHSPHYLDNIPGLALESVVPGITGGGERAFRRQQSGHGVPLAERFGGYHLTGTGPGWPTYWANMLIEFHAGQTVERPIALGELCDATRYPRQTSELLPQLLQEHQVGFVNRALQASFHARELQASGSAGQAQLAELAAPLVRYLLFADEVALPAPVVGSEDFKAAFLQNRRPEANGAALKDFELQHRLFQNRCSYMIYTPTFTGLPAPLRQEVLAQLSRALSNGDAGAEYAYLPAEEKRQIRSILVATLPEFPTP